VQAEGWQHPLYWQDDLDSAYGLGGIRALDPAAPVTQLSYFEADAFARWAGARLPTEFEWEHAARQLRVAARPNLADRGAFHPLPAEGRVSRMAPQLQRILVGALQEGGWLEAHEAAVLKAATTPDDDARLTAVRTLLAEETRLGMLVGVAVGWELARELEGFHEDDSEGD